MNFTSLKTDMHNLMNEFSKHLVLKKVVCTLGVLLILALTFQAGVAVGFHKAEFSRSWGEHYSKNFGEFEDKRRSGLPFAVPRMRSQGFTAHATLGPIVSVSLPNLIVTGVDGAEKIIITSSTTKVTQMREEKSLSNLTSGTFIAVIGEPTADGKIDAKLIRILPAPGEMFGKANSTTTQAK